MTKRITLTYLEFYSGIGGWSCALKEAIENVNKMLMTEKDETIIPDALSMKCLGAFDHSDLCNKVLQHNFPNISDDDERSQTDHDDLHPSSSATQSSKHRRKKRKKSATKMTDGKAVSIESLTKDQLESISAMIFMMSPPCQPHTRQHTNQKEDLNDPRSKSFVHLCDLISVMDVNTLPKIILLENVIGFENSSSCRLWRKTLRARNYCVSHLHLTPTQFDIPNDRPRYYSIAILPSEQSALSLDDEFLLNNSIHYKWFMDNIEVEQENLQDPPRIQLDISLNKDGQNQCSSQDDSTLNPISQYLTLAQNGNNFEDESLLVPEKLLKSNSSWCFDIVTTSDTRSACFTSSYGKFVRGTGSVLYVGSEMSVEEEKLIKLQSPEERQFDDQWKEKFGPMLNGKLRYFSGVEIARLFGFPVSTSNSDSFWSFPSDCSMKQQWRLMGNSLNVRVAAELCEIAICTTLSRDHHKPN